MAHNPTHHTTEDTHIQYHVVREQIAYNAIKVENKDTSLMLADALTKALDVMTSVEYVSSINIL